MDQILAAAISIRNPVLDTLAILIHDDITFVILLLLFILLGEQKLYKLKKIAIAAIFVIVLTVALKNLVKIERPCVNELTNIECPDDYSFPSLHTALTFTIATAFLQRSNYIFYLLFSIFVAFTRLYLGVHGFYDVAGGFVTGVLGYYIVDLFIEGNKQQILPVLEKRRKQFHIFLGLSLLAFLLLAGRFSFVFTLSVITIVGSVVANQYSLGHLKGIDQIRNALERPGVRIMGMGSALYILGILILGATLQDQNKIAGAILIFALGDGAATLIGLDSKHPLPWNKKKTAEGLIGFFLASLPAYIFIGPIILPLALLCAIVETLQLVIDDNITVPVVITAFFLLIT